MHVVAAAGADEAESRVAERRGAGIAHDGHGLAGGEARDQLLGGLGLVVLVQADQGLPPDADQMQQMPGPPCVLSQDHVGLLQNLTGPRRKITKVAKRGGDDPKRSAHR